ncbi:MAG: hypothetical protein ACE5JP_10955 [Candidatus Bipolaricaulia bacterium]
MKWLLIAVLLVLVIVLGLPVLSGEVEWLKSFEPEELGSFFFGVLDYWITVVKTILRLQQDQEPQVI